jgi:hypothetical protein
VTQVESNMTNRTADDIPNAVEKDVETPKKGHKPI